VKLLEFTALFSIVASFHFTFLHFAKSTPKVKIKTLRQMSDLLEIAADSPAADLSQAHGQGKIK